MTKKLIGLLMALCLALGLAACGQKTPAAATAFAQGTTINGMDVSELTPADAAAALAGQTEGYTFTLTLGDKTYSATGEELALTYNESVDLQALLDQQNGDSTLLEFTVEELFSADMSALVSRLELDYAPADTLPAETEEEPQEAAEGEESAEGEEAAEGETDESLITAEDPNAPKNAYLKYDEAAMEYVIVPDESGLSVDCEAVAQQCLEAVTALEPALEIDLEQFEVQADLTADSAEMQEALANANACLDLSLTYSFTPSGGTTSTITLTREQLASLYYLDDTDMSMKVDEEILGSLVSELAEKYSVAGATTKFKTTGGSYININVATAGQSVDSEKLYNDMLDCLTNRTGGTRTAPYLAKSDSGNGYWGGNYVEINLTSQHLWLYKNGTCIVSCDIVSGNVENNTRTPTGCFTIFAKNRDRYLRGNNVDGTKYESWVSYFMPFSGGCGIHDATWRSVFGGDEYLFFGSHGCVGTPLSAAKKIYENVSVGTHVVIYGGKSPSDLPTNTPTVSFAQSEYTIEVGQSIDMGITTNSDGRQWLAFSKAGVVSILDSSTIRGDAVGDVIVGAYTDMSSNYKMGSASVIVHVVPAGTLSKDQNIEVSIGTNLLTVGQTTKFTVKYYQNTPVYSTSNDKVATVDANGKVTAVGAGTVTLTVTCPEGNGYKAATQSITMTVTAPKPVDKAISASAGTDTLMPPNGSTQITVSGAEGRGLNYSANSDLVSVDSNGKVTVVKEPAAETTVTITITAQANSAYNQAQTTVSIVVKPTPTQGGNEGGGSSSGGSVSTGGSGTSTPGSDSTGSSSSASGSTSVPDPGSSPVEDTQPASVDESTSAVDSGAESTQP